MPFLPLARPVWLQSVVLHQGFRRAKLADARRHLGSRKQELSSITWDDVHRRKRP